MNVYAKIGDSFQQIGGQCPPGWISMAGQRPAPEFIAAETGEWVDPASLATLADVKAAKLAEINEGFDGAAQALTVGYPEAERLTWDTQRAEALAWQADPQAATPYLDGLALAREIPAENMRQKTLDQTLLFLQASQQLVGKRQRLRDAIEAAEDEATVQAIAWEEP